MTSPPSPGGALPLSNASLALGGRKQAFVALLELTKPSITALVMVTMLSGALVTPASVDALRLLAALFSTACVVGSANAFNMWLERESDALMARTRRRPLPSGRLAPELALAFAAMLAVVGLTLLATLVGSLAALLGWLALCSYVLAYTPLKRVTTWALHVGAVPGAIPPLIGSASVSGTISDEALILFSFLLVWQLPHFLAIATFRAPEYARAGLKVLPNTAGRRATERAIIVYSLSLLVIALAPALMGIAGSGYAAVALLSSLAFVGCAVHGRGSRAPERWARRLFVASMPYLVVIYAAFVFSRS
jgi:protoheme IX farnesyltransferase